MAIMKQLLWLVLLPAGLFGQNKWERLASARLRTVSFALSEVMLHDGANPPAASRFYAYALTAGYETYALYQTGQSRLQGRVNEYPALRPMVAADSVCAPFAALWAILETGRGIMPSGQELSVRQAELEAFFREKKLPEYRIAGSKAAAEAVAREILNWAKTDGYPQLTALPRYRPTGAPGDWAPTPPDWMGAVEPQWRTLRPFLLDRNTAIEIPEPAPFDTTRGSRFFQLMDEVYQTGRTLNDEQRNIALYWDCNPFAVFHAGHMMIGIKKISPAGHWINIIGQACEQHNIALGKVLHAHALTAMVMADAFIVCWQEKYRSNRIRPITAINRHLDAHWEPVLQTPPFPEYVSGHSAVSAAGAEMLSRLLGENLGFTDHTEVLYGMKPRHFKSFRAAADEASISRLYGGIHFRDALDNGQLQGKAVAEKAWARVGQ